MPHSLLLLSLELTHHWQITWNQNRALWPFSVQIHLLLLVILNQRHGYSTTDGLRQ